MSWRNTDPRKDNDYTSHTEIVILKPIDGKVMAGIGYVDTKHSWDICSYNKFCWIAEKDKWDNSWFWTFGPNSERNDHWQNSDPREYDCENIVIVKPKNLAGISTVMDGWKIKTSFERYEWITADDNWDEDWVWTRA